GEPREVPAGDDTLAQLCGCNMAVGKSALRAAGGFDAMFTTAGDDVDLSWRLRECGETLAMAAGAVVIHERRPTIGAYLAQQRGYGTGEGLLWRKYPHRSGASDAMYGTPSWLSSLFGGGARIYYGAFGRGLFQSIYPGGGPPLALQIPLSFAWIICALVLAAAGASSVPLGVLGCAGLIISLAGATAGAMMAPIDSGEGGPTARAILAALFLLGPLVRSCSREWVKLRIRPVGFTPQPRVFGMSGTVSVALNRAGSVDSIARKELLGGLRAVLLRTGLAIALSDGSQPYDLQIIVPPVIRIPLNALDKGGGHVVLKWRLGLAWPRVIAFSVALEILLLIAGVWWIRALYYLAYCLAAQAGAVVASAMTVPQVLEAAAREVSAGDAGQAA
ncbi:MAG: glycosyltransferase family 2 protein, partial [Candidatus Binataceae bacterium]